MSYDLWALVHGDSKTLVLPVFGDTAVSKCNFNDEIIRGDSLIGRDGHMAAAIPGRTPNIRVVDSVPSAGSCTNLYSTVKGRGGFPSTVL